MAAMESLIMAPPDDVRNWQALMVSVAKKRALDLLKPTPTRHATHQRLEDCDDPSTVEVETDVIEAIDRQRAAVVAASKLAVLDDRHQMVLRECIMHERPQKEVAAELGVTPGRVSQMVKEGLRELREKLDGEGVKP